MGKIQLEKIRPRLMLATNTGNIRFIPNPEYNPRLRKDKTCLHRKLSIEIDLDKIMERRMITSICNRCKKKIEITAMTYRSMNGI